MNYSKMDTTYLEYKSKRIPSAFDGYRILHVSDLHNRMFGSEQSKLVAATKAAAPDMIVFTGDIIDSRRTNIEAVVSYVSKIKTVAPIFSAAGNHEMKSGVYDALSCKLQDFGVNILDNRVEQIYKRGETIAVIGAMDAAFSTDDVFENHLRDLALQSDAPFRILLVHRPVMQVYAKYWFDLVLCGHAHGGQFRLPLIGGLYAPQQGIFPKYTSGIHTENETSMVVSRGLGNSVFPFRLFNRPELVVIELKRI